MAALDTTWFLTASDTTTGRPWGLGTDYAGKAISASPAAPYDAGCVVTPLVGGYAAMVDMRDSLLKVLADAPNHPAGQRGHVYAAGWRFSPLRDLSDTANPWLTDPWKSTSSANDDQTLVGLLLRLILAGVSVRLIGWLPSGTANMADPNMAPELLWLAYAVQWGTAYADTGNPAGQQPTGILGLDSRTPSLTPSRSAHHQKFMVVRSPVLNVAYCGGVDLTATRRDAPASSKLHLGTDPDIPPYHFLDGDWQSGTTVPKLRDGWPHGPAFVTGIPNPSTDPGVDLEPTVYGTGSDHRPQWHDQHLRVEGPIVATLEHQFGDRWVDPGAFVALTGPRQARLTKLTVEPGTAIFTALDADNRPYPLPSVDPQPPITDGRPTSAIQMWRTIPDRPASRIDDDPHRHPVLAGGEYSVLAGYAHALERATNFVWIFDQYFWSVPFARLLNRRVRTAPDLAVLICLPPRADLVDSLSGTGAAQHTARAAALTALYDGLDTATAARVGVWNLWNQQSTRGIYVHAKTHVYDGTLLVCGSANINRRSLLGDTELALAVNDPSLATTHLQNLWTLMFSGSSTSVPWPNDANGVPLDVRTTGGRALLDALTEHAAQANAIPDPWRDQPPRLPRGQRPVLSQWNPQFSLLYNNVLESESLNVGSLERGAPDLSDLSRAVETDRRASGRSS